MDMDFVLKILAGIVLAISASGLVYSYYIPRKYEFELTISDVRKQIVIKTRLKDLLFEIDKKGAHILVVSKGENKLIIFTLEDKEKMKIFPGDRNTQLRVPFASSQVIWYPNGHFLSVANGEEKITLRLEEKETTGEVIYEVTLKFGA